jgi:hypothetical protein
MKNKEYAPFNLSIMENKTSYSLQDANDEFTTEWFKANRPNVKREDWKFENITELKYLWRQVAELYKEKATEELRKENEALKSEIMKQGDTIVSIGKALLKPNEKEVFEKEIERLTQSNKELVEAAKLIISKLVTYHRDNTSPSKEGYNVMVSILDRVIEKSKP